MVQARHILKMHNSKVQTPFFRLLSKTIRPEYRNTQVIFSIKFGKSCHIEITLGRTAKVSPSLRNVTNFLPTFAHGFFM